MQVTLAQPLLRRTVSRESHLAAAGWATKTPHRLLRVASIGYLVPRLDFRCRVHSVFARACNFACGDTLLTLLAPGSDDGPAMLVLARSVADDLRALFDVGDLVHCHSGTARSCRVAFRIADAEVWRPAAPRALLAPSCIDTRLQLAAARLAQRRRTRSSVIDRDAGKLAAALTLACRALDRDLARQSIDRLVGWGEGLTPAGDDFLVGWIAALDRLALHHDARRRFVNELGAVIAAAAAPAACRTTPIAAHALRLAAQGHYGASLGELLDALLGEPRLDRVQAALENALNIGATSGADTVSGLLAGLSAWLPAQAHTA